MVRVPAGGGSKSEGERGVGASLLLLTEATMTKVSEEGAKVPVME